MQTPLELDNQTLVNIINWLKYQEQIKTQGDFATRIGIKAPSLSNLTNGRLPVSKKLKKVIELEFLKQQDPQMKWTDFEKGVMPPQEGSAGDMPMAILDVSFATLQATLDILLENQRLIMRQNSEILTALKK